MQVTSRKSVINCKYGNTKFVNDFQAVHYDRLITKEKFTKYLSNCNVWGKIYATIFLCFDVVCDVGGKGK